MSDVSRDDQKVESENRPARTASEPTGEGDSGTEEAPSDATQTARGRVYHSSEKWSDTSAINTTAPVDTIRLRKDSNSPSVSESRPIALIQKSYKLGYQMFSSQIVFLRKKRCHLR